MKNYPEVKSDIDFAKIEEEVLEYWEKYKIFEKSIQNRNSDGAREFIFYDGPPFANGLPHYGHLLTGFIKDSYARYQTIRSKKVERRFGWDCHGLPAEMQSEKELGFSGRVAITEYGVDKFNKHCRKSVMKYSNEWEKYVKRQARWVDFKNSYKTMDKSFMESVLWAFKELHKKGLIYESLKVMPYSWACETPLSNFETRLDNSYRERADKAITVSFNVGKPRNAPSSIHYKILAWTTTPWTLPSNLALAVKDDMNYACVIKGDTCYIIGEFALHLYEKEIGNYIAGTIKGKDLIGLTYEPILPYFKDHKNGFKILSGDFVNDTSGTGIVHMAPAFGEDDHELCSKHNIEIICPIDSKACFTSEIPDFKGMHVFDANDQVIIKLKKQGSWIKTEQYIHNYPHCWRSDTPLIYKAVPSWYVKVTDIKDRMIELNQQINWIPSNVKNGLFGKWIENARDWSISRNRFWGTPIPVWKSDDPKYPRIDVYGSIEEIEKDFGVKIDDLHRPFIDNLIRINPDDPTGKSKMRRVEDVFDCWFESGSMPYGQVNYPFQNKKWFEDNFPADFIVEYSAQTRGWFYTLMILSVALFDRVPFLNCICHGVILDATGSKLSKRLNNYSDPMDLFKKYGADALRVTMLSSGVTKGQELLIDKEGRMIFDSIRLFIKPIWNAYHFFCLYANSDGVKAKMSTESQSDLDKYILSKLKNTISAIKNHMDSFDSQSAYEEISSFFEILNNWYIRRSRERFWRSELNQDKIDAYNSLYTILVLMMRAICPLMPLISEHIYSSLTNSKSVHLEDFPDVSNIQYYEEIVSAMDQVLDICSVALSIRNTENIRIRQPLSRVKIIAEDSSFMKFEELIRDEVNVKSVEYDGNIKTFADEELSINFPILGKRLPCKIKDIIKALKEKNWMMIKDKILIAGEELSNDEYSLKLKSKESKGTHNLSTNKGMVLLDLNVTNELRNEGIARDIIRLVQNARKDANLDISDKIQLSILSNDLDLNVIDQYKSLIEEQTLSKLKIIEAPIYESEVSLHGNKIRILIKKY